MDNLTIRPQELISADKPSGKESVESFMPLMIIHDHNIFRFEMKKCCKKYKKKGKHCKNCPRE